LRIVRRISRISSLNRHGAEGSEHFFQSLGGAAGRRVEQKMPKKL
jgi:hypothetical protein